MLQSVSFMISRLLSLAVYAAALALIIVTALLAARDPIRRGPALLQAAGAAILLLSGIFSYFIGLLAGAFGTDSIMAVYSIIAMATSLGWILFAGGYFLERRLSRFPPSSEQ
jgi:hypothetical protein